MSNSESMTKQTNRGIEGHWIRFEIQLRDRRAHEAAKLFASGASVSSPGKRHHQQLFRHHQ
jgi:hypothetical protein